MYEGKNLEATKESLTAMKDFAQALKEIKKRDQVGLSHSVATMYI